MSFYLNRKDLVQPDSQYLDSSLKEFICSTGARMTKKKKKKNPPE